MRISAEDCRRMLVFEARRWVGVQEQGGNNQGQLVKIFQRAVDNSAVGEPWCMAFVMYCFEQTNAIVWTFSGEVPDRVLPESEHCLTVWSKTPARARHQKPQPGYVAIWQKAMTMSGHTGIVTSVVGESFKTIEGNTSPGQGVNRDGDGVFEKTHALGAVGTMKLLGFLDPWG